MIVGCETGALAFLITWMQAEGLGVLVFDNVLLQPGAVTKAVGCEIILIVASCFFARWTSHGKNVQNIGIVAM